MAVETNYTLRRDVDNAVVRAVRGAVYGDVNEDSPHPGLQDFLLDAKVEA
jgi:hypothetical protein